MEKQAGHAHQTPRHPTLRRSSVQLILDLGFCPPPAPFMTRRLLALLSAVLLVMPLVLITPQRGEAAMDVAKQVLIGADYFNKDLRGGSPY